MMSGSLPPSSDSMSSQESSSLPYTVGPQGEGRNLGNGHSTPSPLKIFGQAKKKVNVIFTDIEAYVKESEYFLNVVSGQEQNIVSKNHLETIHGFREKVQGITGVLGRDHMKVAFFGRTSNGKSTVINAMLRTKLMPSGIGHTTHCFLQVEGGDGGESYLRTEDSEEHKSVQSVKQLAHALSSVKLDQNSLISIVWPKEKCQLLKDDVVLVDSPGIDVTPDLDSWIDKFCLDADVFVLVANAESTLMQTEKNFFHKVSAKLSKPNIFILNNRWDASASEPEYMEEVKRQHEERNIAFLADELNVTTRAEAANRVFFVSARETLTSRLHQESGTPTPTGALVEGFQARLFEFANFERKFEECISKTAVKTKFAQHTERGKMISGEMRMMMEDVYMNAQHKRDSCGTRRQEAADNLDYTTKQLALLTSETKDKIKQMVENVERKVSSALNEEIRRLSVLVDEFDRPFHPDHMLLTVYKKELHIHLEECLSRNLQIKCTQNIRCLMGGTQTAITERLTALLPEDARQHTANLLPVKDFEVAYRLDCRNLCADFREDIEFRFSLGITTLVNRFLGPKSGKRALLGYNDSIQRPIPMTPQTPSNEVFQPPQQDNSELVVALLGTFASLTSRTTVGAIVVAGLVTKAAGWRIIAVSGVIYGLLYLYERLTWTNKAKERHFKSQYVDYASSKLKLIIDLTSANCSHQVQQELSSVFARLSRQVDQAKLDLAEEIKQLDKECEQLEEIGGKAKILKNKAGWLDSELNSFIHQYLKDTSDESPRS
ncbi:mitofusin-2-like isoform X2 [Lineus longissimus]|uniref:mitofusin-2-like isoform X2 n=1 Tax=Lineus longissimus TaxID=88925 RepID=UPI002B4E943D